MNLAFIGAGNMARAIISSLVKKQLANPADITVSDINSASLELAALQFGVNVTASNIRAVENADAIVLAVKPQNLDSLSGDIGGRFTADQTVISILAGISIGRLTEQLQHTAIIRAMPNTPAQIGMGMTVWTAFKEVPEKHRQTAGMILSAMGDTLWVENENCIDMATAISGSGPAYFFLFMESLLEAAAALGLNRQDAETLVYKTALGSVNYAAVSEASLKELRAQVTSPGGTTAAAIQVFEKENFSGIIQRAAESAYRRARQMGGYSG